MKVKKIIQLGTPGQASPAVYKTERGTFVIQGYKITTSEAEGIERFLPEREYLIEVPEELMKLFMKNFK